jgi:hypothetical protein
VTAARLWLRGSVGALAVYAGVGCSGQPGSPLIGDAGSRADTHTSDASIDGGESGVVPRRKPRIIFDTDMGPDVDDAGALAVVISTTGDDGTPAISFIDAVDTYYGRPNLPIVQAPKR